MVRHPLFSSFARGWFVFIAAFAVGLHANPVTVNVDKKPVELGYGTYPLGHPPPHPGASPDTEAGLCEYYFGCTTLAHYNVPRTVRKTADVTIGGVDITLTLKITIWTGEGTGHEVLAHEETHRAISEHYYQNAEAIVQRLVQKEVPPELTVTGDDKAAAAEVEMRARQKAIVADFMNEVHERCLFAQNRFDAITDHGRAAVTNTDAMRQALAEEQLHWATQVKPQD